MCADEMSKLLPVCHGRGTTTQASRYKWLESGYVRVLWCLLRATPTVVQWACRYSSYGSDKDYHTCETKHSTKRYPNGCAPPKASQL
jgi:hypothetical protein